MRQYKLVIFDLDGTIADTSPGILNCVRYAQSKMNLPKITLEQMYTFVGPPMEESYNKHFGLTGDMLKCAVSLHKKYAIKQGYKELNLYNDIKELFAFLRNNNYKIAVATLKAYETTIKIFNEFELNDAFDLVVGTNIDTPMTKSEMLDFCIDKMGVMKGDAVLIGDSKYDAEGAMKAGIDFIAVTYGFGFKTTDDAKEYPCVSICENASEIMRVFTI